MEPSERHPEIWRTLREQGRHGSQGCSGHRTEMYRDLKMPSVGRKVDRHSMPKNRPRGSFRRNPYGRPFRTRKASCRDSSQKRVSSRIADPMAICNAHCVHRDSNDGLKKWRVTTARTRTNILFGVLRTRSFRTPFNHTPESRLWKQAHPRRICHERGRSQVI